MKNLFTYFIGFLFVAMSYAQQTTFQRTYGGNKHEYVKSIYQNSDGGYIISGSSYGFGTSNNRDAYIVRTNSLGDTLWTRLFRDPNNDNYASNCIQTFDGGFAFTGYGAPGSETSDVYLTKLNSNGTIQWSYNYGLATSIPFGEHGYHVKQTPDSGYVVVGDGYPSGTQHDLYILKTDKNGILQWTKSFGSIGWDNAGNCIVPTSDGGYVATGIVDGSSPVTKIYLVKINGLGNMQWTRTYSFPGHSLHSGIDVKQLSNKDYVITGLNNDGVTYGSHILRTDSMGVVRWCKKYTGGGGNDMLLYSITPTFIGSKGFVLSGTTNAFGNGMYDNIMMRTDTLGNIVWARTTGGANTEYGGYSIQTTDGGFAMLSQCQSYGAGMMDYFFIKTDSMGISGCNQTSPAVITSTVSVTVGSANNNNTGGNRRNPNVSMLLPPTKIDSVCCPIPIINYTHSDTTLCSNQNLSIGTLTQQGMKYIWRPAIFLNDSTIANPVASPTITTQYKVFVYNDCGDTLVDSVTINVIIAPAVTVLSSSVQICAGDSVTLSATGGNNFTWSTGSSDSVIAATPILPTIYSVTLSNGQCTDTANVLINVNLVQANITGDTTICKNESTVLNASGGMAYSWSTGASNATITISPTITTAFSLHSFNGNCSDSTQITVHVYNPPVANAGSNITISKGTSVQLSSSGGNNCSWSPAATLSCVNCCNPIATPAQTTTYYFAITDSNGCSSVDTIIVFVNEDCNELVLPNAFSPNADGNNDQLKLYTVTGCIKQLTLTIYNRWGEKVFETSDPQFQWDGTYKGQELTTQVLVYSISGLLNDNTSINKSGNISLLR